MVNRCARLQLRRGHFQIIGIVLLGGCLMVACGRNAPPPQPSEATYDRIYPTE